ncbi:transglycosylase domain-containing protein [Seonamhaeicola marinus]|uniref:Glycosyl transferase family 51 domain-containing protein n=1 Tax=Seonamhaeicola marinus TaxID=1912246 RepID=A0A5D0HS92_9FLAO|nr:transglycosylase domain-containing protein [Seonamhaeicola marinus]TYA74115.1 hypothetical protein FUA24_12280 [Seonamhaeicola marinus]
MKVFKKLLKVVVWILIIGVFCSVVSYFYLKSTWKEVISEEELTELVDRIEFADELPDRFYDLYNEAYPEVLETNLNKQVVKSFFSKDFVKSPSVLASMISKHSRVDGDSTKISDKKAYVLAWKLEDATTQKQCLNWVLDNYQFSVQFKGIKDIARYYFVKEVHALTDEEIKAVIKLMKTPSLVSIPKTKGLGTY